VPCTRGPRELRRGAAQHGRRDTQRGAAPRTAPAPPVASGARSAMGGAGPPVVVTGGVARKRNSGGMTGGVAGPTGSVPRTAGRKDVTAHGSRGTRGGPARTRPIQLSRGTGQLPREAAICGRSDGGGRHEKHVSGRGWDPLPPMCRSPSACRPLPKHNVHVATLGTLVDTCALTV